MKSSRVLRIIAALAVLSAAAVFFVSCSGEVSDPGKAIDKMLAAYGGPEKAKLLSTYSGKGFMKKLPDIHVADSYPFDIWQKGSLLKTRIMNVSSGALTNVSVLVSDGRDYYRWEYASGRSAVSAWELEILKYRFPLVLSWLTESGVECTLEPAESGGYRLKFNNEDEKVTLTLQKDTWLLTEALVESASDSSFRYSNTYSDYSNVFGVPFPCRVTGYYSGERFFEYYLVRVDIGADIPDAIFGVVPSDTAGIYHRPDTTAAE